MLCKRRSGSASGPAGQCPAGPLTNPQYEAARPPVPCRSYPVSRTTKVIYLVTDEERHELTMLFLGDAREDLRRRFDRMEW